MYGLLQGLQAGTRDAQSANELAMRERQLAEERAMRQRQLAMQEAQHAATMESMGLQLKQQRGVDAAMEGLRGLATRDAAQQQQLGERGIMSFAPEDWTDTSERAYNQKYMGLAAAKGDAEGMNKLQMRGKLLEANEEAQRLAQDMPAARKLILPFFDKSAIPVTIVPGTTDPKTGKQKTPDRIKFEDGYEHEVSDADVVRMLQGAMYSKRGLNDEADKAFESVNKRLRDAVNEGNKRKLEGYKFEETSRHNIANEELRAEQIAAARAARAAALEQKKLGSWQMDRLLKGEKLGQEASGYAQGLAASRAAGPQGKAAADIYSQHLAGVHQQMRGLGLSVPEPKGPPEMKSLGDGMFQLGGEVYTLQPGGKGKDGKPQPPKLVKVAGAGPSALDLALEAYQGQNGAAPLGLAKPTESPEMEMARRIQSLTDEQFAVYQKVQRGEPTNPRERAILKAAGLNF